jgi:ribosome-associated protein
MDIYKLHQSIVKTVEVSYSRSGGPGGQNVNKVNTKVTLLLKLNALDGLSENEYQRLKDTLASRLSADGEELVIQSDEERLQSRNEGIGFIRLERLVITSARLPKKRRPTKPTRASKEKRLNSKRLHGLKKNNRQSGGYECGGC